MIAFGQDIARITGKIIVAIGDIKPDMVNLELVLTTGKVLEVKTKFGKIIGFIDTFGSLTVVLHR